jgi:hypothetical protein
MRESFDKHEQRRRCFSEGAHDVDPLDGIMRIGELFEDRSCARRETLALPAGRGARDAFDEFVIRLYVYRNGVPSNGWVDAYKRSAARPRQYRTLKHPRYIDPLAVRRTRLRSL